MMKSPPVAHLRMSKSYSKCEHLGLDVGALEVGASITSAVGDIGSMSSLIQTS